MQPMLAPLNALTPELRSMQAVWRIFKQLVERLDSLRPTQYRLLKASEMRSFNPVVFRRVQPREPR